MKKKTHRSILAFLLVFTVTVPLVSFAEELTIQGINQQSTAYLSFAKQNPSIRIVCEPMQILNNTAAFTNAMLTGEFKYDVFLVRTSYYDYHRLIEKGYCAELDMSASALEKINVMYSSIYNQVSKEGKIYGVPALVWPQYCYYSTTAWSASGYSSADVPSSFDELCIFLEKWNRRIESDTVENVCVNNMVEDYADWLVTLLVEQQVLQCQYLNEPIRFDSPTFMDLLVRLKSVGEMLNQNETKKGELSLIGYNTSNDIGALTNLIPLRLSNGGPIFIQASLEVYCINPRSKNMALAEQFLETVLQNLDKVECVKLLESAQGPVEDTFYAENLAGWTSEEKNLQSLLSGATDPDARLEITEAMKRHENARESIEKHRYLVTEEQLQSYQSKADYLFFPPPSIFDSTLQEGQSMRQLLAQYVQGSMNAEQLVQELNTMAYMLEEESN